MRRFQLFPLIVALIMAIASCQPPADQVTSPFAAAKWSGLKKMRNVGEIPTSIRISPGLQAKSFLASPGAGAFSTKSYELIHPNGKHHGGDDRLYFDPADPETLPDLVAADGDTLIGGRTASLVSVNGHEPLVIETGALLLLPLPPAAAAISSLQAKFAVQEIDRMGDFYRVKFDLSHVGLERFPELIAGVNRYNQEPVIGMELSSLAAARTVAIASELVAEHQDKFVSVGYNIAGPPPFHGGSGLAPDDYGGHFDNYSDRNLKPSWWGLFRPLQWWLKDIGSNVENAWTYGFGGGVRVGYVDRGFELLGNKDFDRRIDRNLARDFGSTPNQFGLFNKAAEGCIGCLYEGYQLYHGVYSMSAGFAERDDATGRWPAALG